MTIKRPHESALACIAVDYPELNVTNTTEDILHEYYFLKTPLLDFKILIIAAEGYAQSTYNLQIKVYLDDVLKITLTWIETTLTTKSDSCDVSGWADGKHKITIKKVVSGGTGRIQAFENWVKK